MQRFVLKRNPSVLFSIPIRSIQDEAYIYLIDIQRLYPKVSTLFLDGYPLQTVLDEQGCEVEPIRFLANPSRVYEAYVPEEEPWTHQLKLLTQAVHQLALHFAPSPTSSNADLQPEKEEGTSEAPPNYELPPMYDGVVVLNTRMLREGLFALEKHILDDKKVARFVDFRHLNWQKRCNAACQLSDFQSVLLLLQGSLTSDALTESWEEERERWRHEVHECRNLIELMQCLKVFERFIKRDAFAPEWSQLQEDWKEKLKGVC